MARGLSTVEEVALDTEHHSRRCYLGMTCLLQASTGREDWIVDSLALHDEMHALRDVLADPSITKILHGGANDILWLQRDFHLYVVNVFDTEKASQVLGKEQRSLGHLLSTYLGVEQDKTLQRADWRSRPLTQEQIRYARADTHYLPYLASLLRHELVACRSQQQQEQQKQQQHGAAAALPNLVPSPSPLDVAVAKSQQMTLQLYSKPTSAAAAAAAAAGILRKYVEKPGAPAAGWSSAPGALETLKQAVHALARWRDKQARKDDESPQFILPDLLLLSLAQARPASPQALCRLLDSHPAAAAAEPDACRALRKQAGAICTLLSSTADGSYQQQLYALPIGGGAAAWGSGGGRGRAEEGSRRQKEERDREKAWLIKQKFAAKSEVYQNARMLSMDGELLCHCDLKKLEWYVQKGIAERVSDDPPAIRLLFEHKNTDQLAGNSFYSQSKRNICVVCGDSSNFLRYRVVPSCYRRQFPIHLKTHRSHDVVLLCVDCHQLANKSAEATKRAIAVEYGIPLNPPRGAPEAVTPSMAPGADEAAAATASEDEDDELGEPHASEQAAEGDLAHATQAASGLALAGPAAVLPGAGRRAALALQKGRDTIPRERIRELESIIKLCLGRDPVLELEGLRPGDLEAALLAGLGYRKRAQLLRKQASLPGGAAAAAAAVARPPDEGEATAAEPSGFEPAALSSPASQRQQRQQQRGNGHWWHGARVVEAALRRGGEDALHELTRRFRAGFVSACKPRFLPPSWDVHHVVPRAFGDYSVYREPSKDQE